MKIIQKQILLLMVIVLVCSGCIVKTQPLEQLGLATAVGIDQAKGNKLKGVVVLHHFGSRPEDVAQQLTSSGYTDKGLRKFMNLETSDRLVTGQLRVAVYGKELAKKRGIIELVESLKRDASTQTNMYLAISETTARDILFQQKTESSKNMGTYLYKMIRQNIEEEQVVSCTVQEFLRDYYQVGRDPVLPMMEKRRDYVLIDAVALMKGSKFAAKVPARNEFFIRMLRDGYKGTVVDLELPFEPFQKLYKQKNKPKSIHVNIRNITAKRKIQLMKQNPPVFDVDVKLTGSIAELTEEIDLGQPGIYEVFEKAIDKKVKAELIKTIKKMQKINVDPIGFGAIYDTSVRNLSLTNTKWYKNLYPNAQFRIHIDTTIKRSGVLN
ncbi:Ger(x)C family spore germination protein [Bacillus sp. 165]|uniref:Ger(x)C family spore germination protein n=1 Tax=Bacillus sp. 165 TaxID=1529117 RepID=UPI001ADD581C|nr:Ger(x)C family spore germination protein [Bacillus sp. 165]MBO9129337.1 Ger(x)C family spore germination protein [Bacillus sp. 165]